MPIILMSGGNAMKKPYTSFVTGLLVGVALFSGTTAYAAGIMAERSTHRIYVDGREVQMEAYRIKGNNYVKLRDMGEAVGFEVYWDSANGCVQVESGKPYTGEAPVKSTTTKSVEQPAQTDVAAAKQDIIDRTNALRRENGVFIFPHLAKRNLSFTKALQKRSSSMNFSDSSRSRIRAMVS